MLKLPDCASFTSTSYAGSLYTFNLNLVLAYGLELKLKIYMFFLLTWHCSGVLKLLGFLHIMSEDTVVAHVMNLAWKVSNTVYSLFISDPSFHILLREIY